jgi:porphobilinogen deaminase
VLRHLGGGCHLALGTLATELEGMIHLQAVFVSEKNAQMCSATASAPTPGEAARLVADQLMVL